MITKRRSLTMSFTFLQIYCEGSLQIDINYNTILYYKCKI